MARSPTKSNNNTASATGPPTKAAAGNPTQTKFGNAFHQVHNKAFPSSPNQTKVRTIDIDYEILNPLGTCLITFSQHGRNAHPYVYPVLMTLTRDTQLAYKTLRIFMQAVLFSKDTEDRKLKQTNDPTKNVYGLVINFDQQQDHINQTNIKANLLKIVKTLLVYANNIARKPYNNEPTETFTYKNEFQKGNDFTRKNPAPRFLGQLISPQDSVSYMERIFDNMTFEEIVKDHDIIAGLYGNIKEGHALIAIDRPRSIHQEDGDNDHTSNDDNEEDFPAFVAEP